MTVTVAMIRGMNPHAFEDTADHLRKAASKLRTECETYQGKVEYPLAAKQGWHGGGQPDAEVVATINALAFGTSSMRLRASGNVLTGLFHAMTKAQQRLTDVEREAERSGLSLDDDGVVREPAATAVPVGPRGGRAVTPASGHIDRLQRKVDGVVLFAMAADTLAKKQLQSYTKPLITTQTADRALLKRARQDNGAAAEDLLGSIGVEDLLSKAEPRALPPGHTLRSVLEAARQYVVAYAPAALDALAIFAGTWIEATAAADLALGRWAKPAAGDGPVAALAVAERWPSARPTSTSATASRRGAAIASPTTSPWLAPRPGARNRRATNHRGPISWRPRSALHVPNHPRSPRVSSAFRTMSGGRARASIHMTSRTCSVTT